METMTIQRRTITIDSKQAKVKMNWRFAKNRLPRKQKKINKKKFGDAWNKWLFCKGWMMINDEIKL